MPAKRCLETKNKCLLFIDYCTPGSILYATPTVNPLSTGVSLSSPFLKMIPLYDPLFLKSAPLCDSPYGTIIHCIQPHLHLPIKHQPHILYRILNYQGIHLPLEVWSDPKTNPNSHNPDLRCS